MTLYPRVRNIEKGHLVINLMIFISFLVMLTCSIVNICTSKKYLWCLIVGIGIIYSCITVMYSLKRNINIGSNAISILVLCIDFIIGYTGWAINYAIPIIIGIANITILVLTIVSVNKYYKYAIYQLLIVLFSMLPILFIEENMVNNIILGIIASSISILNFIICLILCAKDVKEAIIRKFHM